MEKKLRNGCSIIYIFLKKFEIKEWQSFVGSLFWLGALHLRISYSFLLNYSGWMKWVNTWLIRNQGLLMNSCYLLVSCFEYFFKHLVRIRNFMVFFCLFPILFIVFPWSLWISDCFCYFFCSTSWILKAGCKLPQYGL